MSSTTSSTPSLTPPADAHKSDLASALTLALRKRKIEASNTGDDSEKADAYQAKIDAYKKEKVVPKDAKKMQLEKLMEEFKQKHSKMFNAEDEPSSNSSSSSSADHSTPAKNEGGAPKLESFTIPRTELSQINVLSRKATSPVRTPSTLASGETVTPKKIPLGYTKSQAPAPPSSKEPFASKIVMRSQSSTQKNIPEKRHTVHVSSFKEEDGEGENTNPLQYWKKKDEAVKKPRPTTVVVAQPSIKTVASTIVSFNAVASYKKNPLVHTAVEIKSSSSAVEEEVIVDISDAPEKLSASDLIKTFNASSSTLKKNNSGGGGGGGNVSNIYMNRLKPANTKPKAPQPEKTPAPAVTLSSLPSTTTVVEKPKPPVEVNWVSASTNTNRSSHLVKQQVSPDNTFHGIPPPPPLPPNYSKQQSPSSSSYQSLASTSLTSASYQSSPSPPHQEAQHYSPISISIGGGGPSSTSSSLSHSNYSTSGTPKHISSSSRTSKDGGYYGSSSPIAIVGPPPADSFSSSFDNISPSDLIIPRPPSPMSYSTVIPKGVPPPPRDSWSERFGGGHNSSIVHISHSTNQEESSAEEKSFQKRFNAKDNTSTNFKALFATQKSPEETKPLVRIDSYSSSNSRPGPQKIDFLAAVPAATSFQEEEEEEEEFQTNDVDGYEREGSSIGSDRDQIQNELSSTLARSNLRQRYSPNHSSVSSSDSGQ